MEASDGEGTLLHVAGTWSPVSDRAGAPRDGAPGSRRLVDDVVGRGGADDRGRVADASHRPGDRGGYARRLGRVIAGGRPRPRRAGVRRPCRARDPGSPRRNRDGSAGPPSRRFQLLGRCRGGGAVGPALGALPAVLSPVEVAGASAVRTRFGAAPRSARSAARYGDGEAG